MIYQVEKIQLFAFVGVPKELGIATLQAHAAVRCSSPTATKPNQPDTGKYWFNGVGKLLV